LVAPENDYVTGSVMTIDGGWTAGYSRDFQIAMKERKD
jgi:hypothetical protein